MKSEKERLWKIGIVLQIRMQSGYFVGGDEGNNEKSVWGPSVSWSRLGQVPTSNRSQALPNGSTSHLVLQFSCAMD